MAEALTLDVTVQSLEADAALTRLYQHFRKAGDGALEAHTKVEKFEKGLKDGSARQKAKTELDALAGATTKAGNAAEKAAVQKRSLGSAIASFVAPIAIGAAISKTLTWAGSLSDLSKSTGISTTALQKFEAIGRASGATMGQVANAAIQMSDRLAGGNKSASEALSKVGLSMGQLTSSSPEQALLAVAKAASTIHNPMERVAFLTDVVGKAGAKTLLPMLDDLAAKFDTVSGVIDEKGVKSLDDAGDALADLGRVGTKFLADVLTPMAPAFTFLATAVGDFVSSTIPKLQAWFSGVLEGFMKVEVAFLSFTDRMRNSGLDDMDPGRAAAVRAKNGLGPNGKFNDAQTARDRLGAFQFQPPAPSSSSNGGMFGPAFFQPTSLPAGRAPRGGRTGTMPTPVTPYTANQWAGISEVLRPRNPMGNGGLGSFPGWAVKAPLTNTMSTSARGLGFDRNSMMVPFSAGATMNAPGGGGGGGNWLQKLMGARNGDATGGNWMQKAMGGRLGGQMSSGQMQAFGVGTMAAQWVGQKIGGKAGGALQGAARGAQMGMMLGPWGAAVGGAIGGVAGWIGAGKKAKNAVNQEKSDVFAQFSSKEFIDMQKEADKFGLSLDKALKSKTMKEFGAAVDEVSAKLQKMSAIQSEIDMLTDATTPNFEKMSALAQEFGIDINAMGNAFKQQAMDKEAQKIIDAMAYLEKGGADVNGVLDGMQDEISKVVTDSIKFGTTIPENMKPWVEKLAETGRLTDENGNKITDVSKLKFGEKLESEMDKFVRKLGELIDKLAGVKAGFNGAEGAAADFNNEAGKVPSGPDGPNIPDPIMPSRGGIVGDRGNLLYFDRGGFVPRGTDTVPAMLTPGEMITPAGATREILGALKGRRDGDVTILPVFLDRGASDDEIVEAVYRQLPRRVAGNAYGARTTLTRMLGRGRA